MERCFISTEEKISNQEESSYNILRVNVLKAVNVLRADAHVIEMNRESNRAGDDSQRN